MLSAIITAILIGRNEDRIMTKGTGAKKAVKKPKKDKKAKVNITVQL